MTAVKAYLPEMDAIIIAREGTGDNLLPEDRAEGYVDYIDYEVMEFDGDRFVEGDGGMVLLKELVNDHYQGDEDRVIQDCILMHTGFEERMYILL